MIEKIENLSLKINNSKTGNYTSPYKMNSNHVNFHSVIGDNLQRSEALEYLIEKHWQILEIFFLNDKKLSIKFLFSEIEFKTLIDFSELNYIHELTYSISSEKEINEEKKRLTAIVSVSIDDDNQFENQNNEELKGLKTLIKRLFGLNISTELTSEDSSVLNNMLDDIFTPVFNNLGYINNCLFNFILKLTGSKINRPVTQIRNLQLNKIKVENPAQLPDNT